MARDSAPSKRVYAAGPVYEALEIRYPLLKGWVTAAEVSDDGAWRRGDFVALYCWPVPFAAGHEVKVTRGDWLREANNPTKRSWASFCKLRWYVAPRGVILPEEVPEGWGLIEILGDPEIPKLRQKRAAPAHEVPALPQWLTRVFYKVEQKRARLAGEAKQATARANGEEAKRRLEEVRKQEQKLYDKKCDLDSEWSKLESVWRNLCQLAGVQTSYGRRPKRMEAGEIYAGMEHRAAQRVVESAKRAREACEFLEAAAKEAAATRDSS